MEDRLTDVLFSDPFPKTRSVHKFQKSGFRFDLKNPHSEWIHQVKSKSGFLGFMIRALLWETDPKIVHASVKRSSMQIYLSRHIFSRSCVTKHSIVKKKIQVIIPFSIFEKFSPKVQTEALTRQDNFICVPFL